LRVGLISGPGGSWWFYETGGGAIAKSNSAIKRVLRGEGGCNAASANQTKLGWTMGAGAEWAFAPRWSVRAEYLYVDLGTVTYTSTNSLAINPLATIVHGHTLTKSSRQSGSGLSRASPLRRVCDAPAPWVDVSRWLRDKPLRPARTLVNLPANYVYNDQVTLFGRIDNLLNVQYQDPIGFMRPGLGIFGGVRLTSW
jgi:outer membrane receptor protein involved in Fe transport